MRYGLISDIHGNLEAFQASLDALSKDSIDEYLCIGDVVGYGADPQGCIRLVKSLEPKVLIAGNHEWGVLGLVDLGYFTETAKDAILWTKAVLSQDELEFLKSFRVVYEDETLTLVHGSLESPEKFNYIFNRDDAYFTTRLQKTHLCFVGHTHRPGVFCYNNEAIAYIMEHEVKIDSYKKYIVNVGSIGQPRDGDPRASYAIYDDEKRTIEIRRVEYDIRISQGKILKAGLPVKLAYRLSIGA
ncbi:MAG: metallophosphoesterase family protein [Candidatus Omnitrophica bacterium]|nr:metallophosphoesterase family protein [Candidatus Omnitrophota bacterium]